MRVSWQIIMGVGGILAVSGVAGSASAQTASPYTMPVVTSAANPGNPNGADRVMAPAAKNNLIGEDDIAIPPPPPVANVFGQSGAEKKSWVEMTPEEIWGIAPLKKNTDSKSTSGRQDDFTHSPLQNLVSEQHQAQRHLFQSAESLGDNTSDDPNQAGRLDAAGSPRSETMRAGSDFVSPLNHLLESGRHGFLQEPAEEQFDSVFHAPNTTASAAAKAAEEADLAAFKQMLNPQEQPSSGKSSDFKTISADPNVEPASAKYNPNGNSFLPQDDGINRPKRVSALPTATGAGGSQAPTAPPAWAPQPPPWTLKTPQLFVIPQRKF